MAIGFPAISAGTLSLNGNINGNFEVSSTVGWLYGAAVSPDGTKLFAMDRRAPGGAGAGTQKTGKVHQFTAPAGWYTTFNVNPTYDNVSLNWTGQTSYTRGLRFNTSGNRLYILGENDDVYQYNLGTAWSLSGASYSNNSITLTTVASDVNSILFNNNGTKMYALDGSSNTIYQYTLSTPDDISTATYDGSSSDYVIPGASFPVDFNFNSDGTKLYIQIGSYLHRYSLSVAYDTSTATADNTSASFSSFYVGNGHPSGATSLGGNPTGFIFNHDRSHIFHLHGVYNSTYGEYVSGFVPYAVTEVDGVGDGSTFTFNNRDYIYDGTKEAWEVNSPITVAQTGSPVSDLSELADSTSILSDPANEVLTYADLNAILAVTNPATGQLAFNLDTSDMYIFGGTNWQKVYDEDDLPPPVVWYGDRGVISLGDRSNTKLNTLEYVDITTTGNSTSFGTLTVGQENGTSTAGGDRMVISLGMTATTPATKMEYVTTSSPGTATSFGDLSDSRRAQGGVSNGSRGCFGGGPSTMQIDYITIATESNATAFGTHSSGLGQAWGSSGAEDGTYGLFMGIDDSPGADGPIDYITIATESNATLFGQLTSNRTYGCAVSDSTKAVHCGGAGYVTDMHYVNIATPGNSTSFGSLSLGRSYPAGTSNNSRGIISGGYHTGSNSNYTNSIEYIDIATISSASSFGTISSGAHSNGCASSGNAA